MALTKQSLVVSNRYFVKNTKAKNVGISGCDCHDILSVCLAMTKRERITHHTLVIMSFPPLSLRGTKRRGNLILCSPHSLSLPFN